MKINYGCGSTKLDGFVNIDIEDSVKPDIICDLRKIPLPFDDNSVEEIHCIHNIEHVEYKYWPQFFLEFRRVLKSDGILLLAFPEFSRCAENYVSNKHGKRDFWRATLYGRQLYPGDYHITPVISEDITTILSDHGFKDIKYRPEVGEEHNTFLIALKNENYVPLRNQEDLIKEEVF